MFSLWCFFSGYCLRYWLAVAVCWLVAQNPPLLMFRKMFSCGPLAMWSLQPNLLGTCGSCSVLRLTKRKHTVTLTEIKVKVTVEIGVMVTERRGFRSPQMTGLHLPEVLNLCNQTCVINKAKTVVSFFFLGHWWAYIAVLCLCRLHGNALQLQILKSKVMKTPLEGVSEDVMRDAFTEVKKAR